MALGSAPISSLGSDWPSWLFCICVSAPSSLSIFTHCSDRFCSSSLSLPPSLFFLSLHLCQTPLSPVHHPPLVSLSRSATLLLSLVVRAPRHTSAGAVSTILLARSSQPCARSGGRGAGKPMSSMGLMWTPPGAPGGSAAVGRIQHAVTCALSGFK